MSCRWFKSFSGMLLTPYVAPHVSVTSRRNANAINGWASRVGNRAITEHGRASKRQTLPNIGIFSNRWYAENMPKEAQTAAVIRQECGIIVEPDMVKANRKGSGVIASNAPSR